MRKYLTLAFCLFSFACVHAQTYIAHSFTSGHIHVDIVDSMMHDSTTCTSLDLPYYTITIDSSYLGDSINIVDSAYGLLLGGSPYVNTTGASPWVINPPMDGFGFDDAWVPVGGGYLYFFPGTVKVTTPLDTVHINYMDSLWVLPCLYGNVSGKIYIDNNSNCIKDAGDTILHEFINPVLVDYISVPPGTKSFEGIGTDIYWGHYSLNVQKSWMTSYTVSLPTAYAFIFPMSPCFLGPYTFTTMPQTDVDFPLLCTSNIDLQCNILSAGRVRLHSPFFLHPYTSNSGCDSISGTMTLVKDSRVIYNAGLSTNPADTVRGDTLIWNYQHLSSLSAGAYWNSFLSDIYMTHDSTVHAGDTLCFRVYTQLPPADVNLSNNDVTICLPVVYSYDPNSKDISPAGTGPDGNLPPNTKTLTYTINFQNTGSDVAYDVKIIDTLDSHLDAKSLKILGTSHNMIPKWLTSNIVEFDFNGIMLPDSTTSEPKSHGQVKFSINLKDGLPVGTHIKNTGYIYFDMNPAVVTNTTYNTTVHSSAVPQVVAPKKMKIYPNPAVDQITVENMGEGDLYVLDMNGSVRITQHVTDNKTTIDISHLAPGVYMLKTVNNTNTTTNKFTKY